MPTVAVTVDCDTNIVNAPCSCTRDCGLYTAVLVSHVVQNLKKIVNGQRVGLPPPPWDVIEISFFGKKNIKKCRALRKLCKWL